MSGSLIPRSKKRNPKQREITFLEGSELVRPDHAPRYIYFLKSGRVRLSHGTGGKQAIVDHLAPGSFFGEKCILLGPYRQTAMSLSPGKVLVFRKTELMRRIQRDHRFALRFFRSLALRLDRYEQTIYSFVTDRTERRLVRALLALAPKGSGWVRLPFDFTNPEMSRMAGTTRWRVSKLLNDFQRREWLRRRDGIWVNREALQEFLAATG
jgi:CRP-like cAMP-binding protein